MKKIKCKKEHHTTYQTIYSLKHILKTDRRCQVNTYRRETWIGAPIFIISLNRKSTPITIKFIHHSHRASWVQLNFPLHFDCCQLAPLPPLVVTCLKYVLHTTTMHRSLIIMAIAIYILEIQGGLPSMLFHIQMRMIQVYCQDWLYGRPPRLN